MTKIGLLSDTHGYIHPKLCDFFNPCNEIWHAGDIGSIEALNYLKNLKTFRGVFGNIDDTNIRTQLPEFNQFTCEDVSVLITHIGGYPGKYNRKALQQINQLKPRLFIAGHSHILKVIHDKSHNLLHINPGAAGRQGLHQLITMVRFDIEGNQIMNLEIFESSK